MKEPLDYEPKEDKNSSSKATLLVLSLGHIVCVLSYFVFDLLGFEEWDDVALILAFIFLIPSIKIAFFTKSK